MTTTRISVYSVQCALQDCNGARRGDGEVAMATRKPLGERNGKPHYGYTAPRQYRCGHLWVPQ